MGFLDYLRALALGIATVLSPAAFPQDISDSTDSQSLGIAGDYYILNTGEIISGIAGNDYGDFSKKGRNRDVYSVGFSAEKSLTDFIALGPLNFMAFIGGGFIASSTEFPGADMGQEGNVNFAMSRKKGAPIMRADYEINGSLTLYTLYGRANTVFWYGTGTIRPGFRIIGGAGIDVLHGDVRFNSWFSNDPYKNSLVEGKFNMFGYGILVKGSAGPALKVKSVECFGTFGSRGDFVWIDVKGDIYQFRRRVDNLNNVFPVRNLSKAVNLECLLRF